MFNKSGFNVKTRMYLPKRGLLLRAFADEAGDEGSNNPPTVVNFEELIAAARKEEKEKLYPRIKKLEEDNKNLLKANNDYLLTIADYKSKLEALEKAGDTDEVVTLRDTLAKVQKEFEDYKATAPNEQDIRSKVEAEYEVKYYRQTELAKHKDDILSIFADEVTGDTKEDIDASIELVKKKTIDVKKQLGILDSEGNPVEKKPAPKKKEKTPDNPAPATPPVANPTDEGDETFDFDYVQSLDPRSKEYAEFRKKMGLK